MKTQVLVMLAVVLAALMGGCGGDSFSAVGLDPLDAAGDNLAPDSLAPDQVTPENDSGSDVLAASDAGTGDAAPDAAEAGQEAGSDADAAPEAGEDATPEASPDAMPEAGSDALPDALDTDQDAAPTGDGGTGDVVAVDTTGPCITGLVQCDGDQPKVCQGGTWADNGGVCHYGCDQATALCKCDDMTRFVWGPIWDAEKRMTFTDTKTGLLWAPSASLGVQGPQAALTTACQDKGYRLPTRAELEAVMPQGYPNVSCFTGVVSKPSDWLTSGGGLSGTMWTSTNVGVGLAYAVNVGDGSAKADSTTINHGAICVK